MSHRLSPLFDAQSIAVIGASAAPGSFGERLAQASLSARFGGQLDFVNPRGGEIAGRPVRRSLAELPQRPELVVLGVGARNLETALVQSLEAGARGAVIFDACHGDDREGRAILPRLRAIAREARLPVCGGSGMGVLNVHSGLVASFYPADSLKPGGISLIAHSGSVFTVLGMNDPRFRFDLVASPGQEIGATIDEYIACAAARDSTRVIAVFMESARTRARWPAATPPTKRCSPSAAPSPSTAWTP